MRRPSRSRPPTPTWCWRSAAAARTGRWLPRRWAASPCGGCSRGFAGLAEAAPAADVSAFVAGLTCLTWELPSDEIWFLHLAVGHHHHGGRSTSWIVDGQDVD
ncbi:hypothetical protein [Streptomyces sp. NPDC059994]|uniref:hypothetical protein n=1 Tax=Streptomyces sp. NPDC059994 TaxID=3347029 RepID=UPI003683F984